MENSIQINDGTLYQKPSNLIKSKNYQTLINLNEPFSIVTDENYQPQCVISFEIWRNIMCNIELKKNLVKYRLNQYQEPKTKFRYNNQELSNESKCSCFSILSGKFQADRIMKANNNLIDIMYPSDPEINFIPELKKLNYNSKYKYRIIIQLINQHF